MRREGVCGGADVDEVRAGKSPSDIVMARCPPDLLQYLHWQAGRDPSSGRSSQYAWGINSGTERNLLVCADPAWL